MELLNLRRLEKASYQCRHLMFTKQLAHIFDITLIDEFNTTRKCYSCGKDLKAVMSKKIEDKHYEIRGLKWCPECKHFKNRDLNSAFNIKYCYEFMLNHDNERPDYLSRDINHGERPDAYYSNLSVKIKSKDE